MVVIDNEAELATDADLKTKEDYKKWFERNGTNKIIKSADGRYCTYQSLMSGIEPEDIRVRYSPDMFLEAQLFIAKYGYAIAADENGNEAAILKQKPCTYAHHYEYSGGADMWFLNQHDCIFLHDCNEYSVELCQSALRLWEGKRLVLVGKNWERMIPLLPDLEGIECFYEEELYTDRYKVLIEGGEKTAADLLWHTACRTN